MERRLLVPSSLQKLCLCLWGLKNGTHRSFSSSPNSTILRHGTKGLRHGHSSLLGLGNPSGSITHILSHCEVGPQSFSCPSWSTNHFSGRAVTVCSQINHMCPMDLCVHGARLSYLHKNTSDWQAHHICTEDVTLVVSDLLQLHNILMCTNQELLF